MTKKAITAIEQFVLGYIVANRKEGYAGLHTVYGGLNADLRKAFPGTDPVATVTAMEKAGLIDGRPAKGGHMIFLKGEMPRSDKKSDERIAKAKAAVGQVVANKTATVDPNAEVKALLTALLKKLS